MCFYVKLGVLMFKNKLRMDQSEKGNVGSSERKHRNLGKKWVEEFDFLFHKV